MGETRDPELMCVCVVPRRSKDLLANPKKVVESATANEPLDLGFARSTRNKVEQKYTLRTWRLQTARDFNDQTRSCADVRESCEVERGEREARKKEGSAYSTGHNRVAI